MRVRLALVPLAAAAALLAGCATTTGTATPTTPVPTTPASNGVADLSADQILAKATTALKNVKSFHVKGTKTTDGTSTTLDFVFSGGNASGKIDTSGLTIEMVIIDKDLYVKAPDAFWTGMIPSSQASVLASLKGKYAKLNGANPIFADLMKIANTDEILKPEGTVSKGDTKTIKDVPAIGLIDSKDKSVLYIATQGEPLPLAGEGPAATDKIEFSEYGTASEVKAPDAANVLDLKSIIG